MQKKTKQRLSFCLSMAVTVAALPLNGIAYAADEITGDVPAAENVVSDVTPADIPDEVFSVIAVESGQSELIADGENVGMSYGGVSINSDNEITFEVDGREMPLNEAENAIGCDVIVNENGDRFIVSPFQTSRLIVKAEKEFDNCGALLEEERFENIYLLTYTSPLEAYSAYIRLANDENVIFAEPDAIVTAAETDSEFENDIESWGNQAIGTKEFRRRLNEEKDELPEVKVAVVDTGIYYGHREFEGRILEGGKSFCSYDDDDIPDDQHGHGSHCAGIICSSTNKNVKILPVQALSNEGAGTIMDIYSSMMYAIEQNVNIISLSLGGSGKSNLLDEAVAAAVKKDITVCVAAGNESYDANEMFGSLAANEQCVVVASVNSNYEPSYFSNSGSIDFAAPGEKILSVSIDGENSSVELSGTSMATPFVAGCFANMLSYDINFTSEQAYDLLKENAIDLCEPGYDNKTGWGLVNLHNFNFNGVRIEIPSASLKAGSYDKSIEVELSCLTEGAEIYYTTNGTAPTKETGKRYNGTPITIESSTKLRFVAIVGDTVSKEQSEYYIIGGVEDANSFDVVGGVIVRYRGKNSSLDIAKMVGDGSLPPITAIGEDVFIDNETLTEIILPDSVKTIGKNAFYACTSLKTVVSNASFIGEYAFGKCTSLVSFTSKDIRRVNESAFEGCVMLEDIYGRKLTELGNKAFKNCRKLGNDCFDLSAIRIFGAESLMGTAIDGKIDVSKADCKYGVFKNTNIEEVILPQNMRFLPGDLLNGCKNLRKISAPGVSEIGPGALALGKTEFSQENMVETDIDFSSITLALADSFNGFVFDRPIEFKNLGDALQAFAGAYGEYISLPNCKNIDGYQKRYNINVIELENLQSIEEDAVYSAHAIVVGDKFSNLANDPGMDSGCFFYEGSKPKLEDALDDFCIDYGGIPDIYCENYKYTFYKHDVESIMAASVGDGTRGEWYFYDAESDTETLLDTPGIFPQPVDTSRTGTIYYIYKQFDEDNNLLNSEKIPVSVVERKAAEVSESEYLPMNISPIRANSKNEKVVEVAFTPDKTCDYTIHSVYCNIDVYDDGDQLVKHFVPRGKEDLRTMQKTFDIALEAGRKYIFRMSIDASLFDDSDARFSDNKFYFAATYADSGKVCITSLEGNVRWDTFRGKLPFEPYADICDKGYMLRKDTDYTIELDEELHFGKNHYAVQGIGKYFGAFEDDNVNLEPAAEAETEMECAVNKMILFTPETSGLYKITAKPYRSLVDKAVGAGEYIETSNYNNNVSIYHKKWTLSHNDNYSYEHYYYKDIELTDYDHPYSSNDCASSATFETSVVEMTAGELYAIKSYSNQIVKITQDLVLSECTFDYELNRDFDGEPIIPEISVKSPDGRLLREGTDYTLTYWNNDKPGIMFVYIEGINECSGVKTLAINIRDGEHADYIRFNGKTVADVKLGQKFYVVGGILHLITFDEDTLVEIVSTKKVECPPDIVFSNTETEYPDYVIRGEDFLDGGADEDEPLLIKKGQYLVSISQPGFYISYDIFESKPFEMIFRKCTDMTYIADCDIRVKNPVCNGSEVKPEISIFDGETELRSGTDYYVYYENTYSEPGCYETIITGKRNYGGEITVPYIIEPADAEITGTLTDGINTIENDSDKKFMVFEWTPESSHYYLTSSTFSNVEMTIVDENGINAASKVLRQIDVNEIDVTPNKKYTVFMMSDTKNNFDIGFMTSGLLGECEVTYTKAIEYTGKKSVPDAVFRDGGYTLVEGKDYELVNNGFIDNIGRQEFVYRGTGKYFGDVKLARTVYKPEMPADVEYKLLYANMYTKSGYGEMPGEKTYFKYTSQLDTAADYVFKAFTCLTGKPAERTTILAYDQNGGFIGANEDAEHFTLGAGETVYFVIVSPYVMENLIDITNIFVSLIVTIDDIHEAPAELLKGDANGDGTVNIKDIILIRRYIVGGWEADINAAAADVNGDGEVNIKDIIILRREFVGGWNK